MSRGLFITFEGGDGTGKTTQSSMLAEQLERDGFEVVRTREPGGTETGKRIREIVLHSRAHIDPKAEALLYAADRAQHVATLVRPALERGAIVVQDRYIDSSVAYQGAGRALDPEKIAELSAWATDELMPDITILLDAEPAAVAARLTGKPFDRLEAEGNEFRTRLRDAFVQIAVANPRRVHVFDALEHPGTIGGTIASSVHAELQNRGIRA